MATVAPPSALAESPGYRTKAEVATDLLRRAVLSGDLRPGEELTVIDLARRFALTRMPLREALSRLAAEGLVELSAHQPARVADVTRERLQEEYFVRGLIEAAAAAEAALHLDDATFDELEALLRRMDKARDARRAREYWDLTRRYHERIYAANPSRVLREEVERMRTRTLRYLPIFANDHGLVEHSQAEHWRILRALRSRDRRRIERLVRSHVATLASAVKLMGAERGRRIERAGGE